MKRITIVSALAVTCSLQAVADEPLRVTRHTSLATRPTTPASRHTNGYFTGIPKVDFFSLPTRLPQDSIAAIDAEGLSEPPNKSPALAGALSLGLPGAGEFYSESYLKSAIFFALEVTGWIVAYSYDKKGDRQTNIFQDYADAHWSVVKYAEWLISFRNGSSNIITSQNASLPPWQRVNWDTLNFYERQGGLGFTHTLPPYGEQQYYELIGKYHQYSSGWDDFGPNNPDFMQISARFTEYSRMRGKANDYYNIASTAVSIVVVNHIISAIDAYFTASGYNKSFHAGARMNLRHTPFGPVAETVGEIKVMF